MSGSVESRRGGRRRAPCPVAPVVPTQPRMSSATGTPPQRQSEGAQIDLAPAEPTGGLEELPRLQGAAEEVVLDGRRAGRSGGAGAPAFARARGRARERRDGGRVADPGELRERAGEEIVAAARGRLAVGCPRRRMAASEHRCVQEIADECRHVHEPTRRPPPRADARRREIRRRRQEDSNRSEPLSSRGESPVPTCDTSLDATGPPVRAWSSSTSR